MEFPGACALRSYLQELQDFDEQVEHPLDGCFNRLEPPPMPKAEISFRMSRLSQDGQQIRPSPLIVTSFSKWRPQALH